MRAHSDSRGSDASPELRLTPLPVERVDTARIGRTSWTPYPLPDELEPRTPQPSRTSGEAVPMPHDSNPASTHTRALAEWLARFSGKSSGARSHEPKDGDDALAGRVKRLVRSLRQKVAALGASRERRREHP
ncbi:MAG: hypothetical protein HYV09_26160 [Deltaproteobacteria bacterium]|nr:hypothetical protein [Deltaproteobacteria bacterium]